MDKLKVVSEMQKGSYIIEVTDDKGNMVKQIIAINSKIKVYDAKEAALVVDCK